MRELGISFLSSKVQKWTWATSKLHAVGDSSSTVYKKHGSATVIAIIRPNWCIADGGIFARRSVQQTRSAIVNYHGTLWAHESADNVSLSFERENSRRREKELWAINKTPATDFEEALVGDGERAKRFRNNIGWEVNESRGNGTLLSSSPPNVCRGTIESVHQ